MLKRLLFAHNSYFKPRLTTKLTVIGSAAYVYCSDISTINENQQFNTQYYNTIEYSHQPSILTSRHNITVLIPTYNEAQNIQHVLRTIVNNAHVQQNSDSDTDFIQKLTDKALQAIESITSLVTNNTNNTAILHTDTPTQHNTHIQYILCDGGSTDNTIQLAKQTIPNITIHTYPPNTVPFYRTRAYLLNTAVQQHTNNTDILVFCHADTVMPNNWASHVIAALNKPAAVLGAFKFGLDATDTVPLSNELIQAVNFRAQYTSLPYGDQCLFMRRNTFEQLRGFHAQMSIMEDIDFVHRSKQYGVIDIADATAVTSNKRYKQIGIVTNTLINQLCVVMYSLGIPTNVIRSLYTYTYRLFYDPYTLLQQTTNSVKDKVHEFAAVATTPQ